MATPTFALGPPPDPKDPRRLQWDALLWSYLKDLSQSQNSSDIISIDSFMKSSAVAGQAPGLDVAEKQMILANQIYGS